MKDDAPPRGAVGIASVADYSRVLSASMRLVKGTTRTSVVREIVAGVEAQVEAHGGDFARAAPDLDDPRWVGRQMVKVYGCAPWVSAVVVGVAALLALVSVPGLTVQPPDGAAAIAVALVGFGALVALVLWGSMAVSARTGAVAGLVAAAARLLGLLLPQGEFSPAQLASTGELTLFLSATGLLLAVAVVPILASRSRAAGE